MVAEFVERSQHKNHPERRRLPGLYDRGDQHDTQRRLLHGLMASTLPANILVSQGFPARPDTTEAALAGGLTSLGCALDKSIWVETRGIEPLTPALQRQCSAN